MKVLCTILIITGSSLMATAQKYDPDKVNKKAVALYEQASQKADDGDYKESIRLLQEAVKIDPRYMEAWLSIAGMRGEQKNYREAVDNYIKAKAIDTAWFKDYNQPYSIYLAGLGEFQKALSAVDEFLTIPDLNEKSRKAG